MTHSTLGPKQQSPSRVQGPLNQATARPHLRVAPLLRHAAALLAAHRLGDVQPKGGVRCTRCCLGLRGMGEWGWGRVGVGQEEWIEMGQGGAACS